MPRPSFLTRAITFWSSATTAVARNGIPGAGSSRPWRSRSWQREKAPTSSSPPPSIRRIRIVGRHIGSRPPRQPPPSSPPCAPAHGAPRRLERARRRRGEERDGLLDLGTAALRTGVLFFTLCVAAHHLEEIAAL